MPRIYVAYLRGSGIRERQFHGKDSNIYSLARGENFFLMFVFQSKTLNCVIIAIIFYLDTSYYKDFVHPLKLTARSKCPQCLPHKSGPVWIHIIRFNCLIDVYNLFIYLQFGILLGTCLLMELTGGLAGFILSEKAYSVVTYNLHQTMELYNKTKEMAHIWDGLQTTVI